MATKSLSRVLPSSESTKSIQFELFGSFVTNDGTEVSNTLELWDNIPKYFFTTKQIEKLRTPDGLASSVTWKYTQDGHLCSVRIQPALIVQKNGKDKAFFPSVTEELIEEALKKSLSDQSYGLHDTERRETWIRFTLGMLQKELKIRGRARSIAEIKQAIQVMNRCNLAYYCDGKEVWSGSILQDLIAVGRNEYRADKDAQHIAKLPLFITRSIDHLKYRQFNYDRLMQCDEQLSRWMYRRFINRFTQANWINSYHFKYSTLKADSGLLQQSTEASNRKKVISAFKELIEKGVIAKYETIDSKKSNKIIDVTYEIWPSAEFIREQKAANKRASDHLVTAKQARVLK